VAARHLITGRAGEELAGLFLVEKGYRIVVRNFRCAGGEIDLICEDQGTLVFVEVKTRSCVDRGEPGEAVGRAKKIRLTKAASLYLSQNRAWSRPCRFDLVSVLFLDGETVVEHWEDIIDVRDGLDRGHAPWQPW
jgi:putative endonuclease